MAAYYNEIDPFAAAWLAELMRAGLIADGEIDTRSIEHVDAADLAGFRQCHFFAGLGGWSYALRLAGWPDERPVWTGSCPCQPFSRAGKQRGITDRRHLWPEFYRLIRERRPAICIGEQVAGPAGLAWWDIVSHDLENGGYACGAVDFPAASVGAPHIRQRLYWCAVPDASGGGAYVWGWPTPAATDGKGGYRGGRMRRGKLSTDRLDVAARLAGWPTPTASNGNGARPNPLEQDYPNLQTTAVLAGWCTPTATDAQRGRGTIRPWDTGLPLPQQASLARPPDSGNSPTGNGAGTANTGQLNPALSLWLMGLPDEWLSCAVSAIQSSPRRRRRSSKP